MKFDQCIICGKENPEYEQFCSNCYKLDHPLILKRNRLRISFCIQCGAIFYDDEWHKQKEDKSHITTAIRRTIESSYKFKRTIPYNISVNNYEYTFFGEDPHAGRMSTNISIEWYPEPDKFKQALYSEEEIDINLRWRNCSFCQKIMTEGYVAKIQLRGKFDNTLIIDQINSVLKTLDEKGAKRSYIISQEEPPEGKHLGVDLRLGTKQGAKKIAEEMKNRYACQIIESNEGISIDRHSNKVKSRLVVLVRFPNFEVGDIVKEKDEILQLLSISAGRVTVFDLKSIQQKNYKSKWLWTPNLTLLVNYDNLDEFQLISTEENDNAALIMDLKNYETSYIDKNLIKIRKGEDIFKGYVNEGNIIPSQWNP